MQRRFFFESYYIRCKIHIQKKTNPIILLLCLTRFFLDFVQLSLGISVKFFVISSSQRLKDCFAAETHFLLFFLLFADQIGNHFRNSLRSVFDIRKNVYGYLFETIGQVHVSRFLCHAEVLVLLIGVKDK